MLGTKYSLMTIISFIFGVFSVSLSLISFYHTAIFIEVLLILSIILAIAFIVLGLVQIKKNSKLKGKSFILIAIILVIFAIFVIIFRNNYV